MDLLFLVFWICCSHHPTQNLSGTGTREQMVSLDPASWQEKVQPCKWVTLHRRAPVSTEHKSSVSSVVQRGHRSSVEDGNAK